MTSKRPATLWLTLPENTFGLCCGSVSHLRGAIEFNGTDVQEEEWKHSEEGDAEGPAESQTRKEV